MIEGTITIILTDSELKILQKKAKQSVAPSEEFNNLRSTPGDMGNQEACEMNVVENCVDQNQMLDPNTSSQRSNAKKSLI